jgi:hypothetical protein
MGDDLRTLQARFFRFVTEQGTTPGRGPSWDWLQAKDPATPRERVQVYRDGYAFRCLECLRDDFPAVAALVGDEGFAGLAGDYMARHPSTTPSLRHLGTHFAAFAAASELGRRWPWIGELADLEWARVEVFDAPDAAPMTTDHLRAVSPTEWPSLRLRLAPSVRILELRHAIDLVWRALQDTSQCPGAPLDPTSLVVYRRAHVVYHRRVEAREGEALRQVSQGATFSDVCEVFADAESVDRAAQRAFDAMAQWMADGLMARDGALCPRLCAS